MSIRRNAGYNLLGSIITIAVSLITIPVYLELIGEARYGVLAIAWLLLGYFGLFDLGLGRATAQSIATQSHGTDSERATTFWTALTLNVGIGVIGGVLIWPAAEYFFGNVFKVEDAIRPEVQAAVPWLVLAVPIATISGVLTGALQGRERFLELNMISTTGTILFQILPLIVATLWGADLALMLIAALFARLITMLILFLRCKRHIVGNNPFIFVRFQAGQLLRFGGWVTVTSFVGPMMVVLDRFIIGALISAKAVSYYTVPFQMAQRTAIFSGALTSALFPRFAVTTKEKEQQLALNGLRVLVVVITPLLTLGIFIMGPFLSWWITPAFAQEATLLGQIMLLGFWINSLAGIPYAQLQAKGRPDLVAKCHLGELLPYFAALYFGLNTLGLAGAAAAFSIRALADFGLLAGLAGILRQSLVPLLPPLLLLVAAFIAARYTVPGQVKWYIITSLHFAATLAWVWWQAPSQLRSILMARVSPPAKST